MYAATRPSTIAMTPKVTVAGLIRFTSSLLSTGANARLSRLGVRRVLCHSKQRSNGVPTYERKWDAATSMECVRRVGVVNWQQRVVISH